MGALIGSAFLGAKSTYLLGLEKRGVPARQSLRRIGDLILMKEGDHQIDKVTSCAPRCLVGKHFRRATETPFNMNFDVRS